MNLETIFNKLNHSFLVFQYRVSVIEELMLMTRRNVEKRAALDSKLNDRPNTFTFVDLMPHSGAHVSHLHLLMGPIRLHNSSDNSHIFSTIAHKK